MFYYTVEIFICIKIYSNLRFRIRLSYLFYMHVILVILKRQVTVMLIGLNEKLKGIPLSTKPEVRR